MGITKDKKLNISIFKQPILLMGFVFLMLADALMSLFYKFVGLLIDAFIFLYSTKEKVVKFFRNEISLSIKKSKLSEYTISSNDIEVFDIDDDFLADSSEVIVDVSSDNVLQKIISKRKSNILEKNKDESDEDYSRRLYKARISALAELFTKDNRSFESISKILKKDKKELQEKIANHKGYISKALGFFLTEDAAMLAKLCIEDAEKFIDISILTIEKIKVLDLSNEESKPQVAEILSSWLMCFFGTMHSQIKNVSSILMGLSSFTLDTIKCVKDGEVKSMERDDWNLFSRSANEHIFQKVIKLIDLFYKHDSGRIFGEWLPFMLSLPVCMKSFIKDIDKFIDNSYYIHVPFGIGSVIDIDKVVNNFANSDINITKCGGIQRLFRYLIEVGCEKVMSSFVEEVPRAIHSFVGNVSELEEVIVCNESKEIDLFDIDNFPNTLKKLDFLVRRIEKSLNSCLLALRLMHRKNAAKEVSGGFSIKSLKRLFDKSKLKMFLDKFDEPSEDDDLSPPNIEKNIEFLESVRKSFCDMSDRCLDIKKIIEKTSLKIKFPNGFGSSDQDIKSIKSKSLDMIDLCNKVLDKNIGFRKLSGIDGFNDLNKEVDVLKKFCDQFSDTVNNKPSCNLDDAFNQEFIDFKSPLIAI